MLALAFLLSCLIPLLDDAVYIVECRSDLGYFALLDLDHLLLEFLQPPLLEVELALVILRHPVTVAEHELALAFVAQ